MPDYVQIGKKNTWILSGSVITSVLVRTIVTVFVGTIAVVPHRDALEAVPASELFFAADNGVDGGGGWARRRGLWGTPSQSGTNSPHLDPIHTSIK